MNKIYSTHDNHDPKKLSRLSREGKLRRIYQGIYTDNLDMPLEKVIYNHWMQVVSHIVPSGILSFRTAHELRPTPFESQFIVFLTSSYNKTVTLPGLVIKIIKGNHTSFCEPIIPQLNSTNLPRTLLENLSTVRGVRYRGIKTIGKENVERVLATLLQRHDEAYLNHLRDEAKDISKKLNYHREFDQLNSIIGALLSTSSIDELSNQYAKSIARSEPFDINRITLFEKLASYLKKCQLVTRNYTFSMVSFRNIAFFESYFSNYIEGTQFLIDEAEDITFQGKEINHRHEDSHDVQAHFLLSNDYTEISITPRTAEELLSLLKNRHHYLMSARSDKQPGIFKDKPNQAGNTLFVEPKNVIGTLCHGFDIYQTLEEGFPRSLFMHFMISEVHPFIDGNGRLSRVMMNAELVKHELFKIIVPTVHRDNYLNGLRLATRDGNFHIYTKVLDQAHAYTASVDWQLYGEAREKIENDFADKTPDEGLPTFNRVLRKLTLSDIPLQSTT